jgi:hypothetical protein
MLQVYLPVAEISVNLLLMLWLGAVIGYVCVCSKSARES